MYTKQKERVPSWCDRVLTHTLNGAPLLLHRRLGATDTLTTSDHNAVYAHLELTLPAPVPPTEPLFLCVVGLENLTSSTLDLGELAPRTAPPLPPLRLSPPVSQPATPRLAHQASSRTAAARIGRSTTTAAASPSSSTPTCPVWTPRKRSRRVT